MSGRGRTREARLAARVTAGVLLLFAILLLPFSACDSFLEAPSRREGRPKEPGFSPLVLPSPVAGLKLELVPNLPGIADADIPASSVRRVEILEARGRSLTLRWSGLTRVETARSLTLREKWLRSRIDGPAKRAAPAEPQVEYEEQEVTGTLTFPDFGFAGTYLLPGLWPEGKARFAGTTTLWLSSEISTDLYEKRKTNITFFLERPLGTDPVHVLFRRVMSDQKPIHGNQNLWEIDGDSAPVTIALNGTDVAVEAYPVRHWLGYAEVAEVASGVLVLSMLPEIRAALADSGTSANMIRTFFGYRIASIEQPLTQARRP